MRHGYGLHDIHAMTARQLSLFYNEALKAEQLQQADRLDAMSLAFNGQPSPTAQHIRELHGTH